MHVYMYSSMQWISMMQFAFAWPQVVCGVTVAWHTVHTHNTKATCVCQRLSLSRNNTSPVFVRMYDQNGHGSDRIWLSSKEVVWKTGERG